MCRVCPVCPVLCVPCAVCAVCALCCALCAMCAILSVMSCRTPTWPMEFPSLLRPFLLSLRRECRFHSDEYCPRAVFGHVTDRKAYSHSSFLDVKVVRKTVETVVLNVPGKLFRVISVVCYFWSAVIRGLDCFFGIFLCLSQRQRKALAHDDVRQWKCIHLMFYFWLPW